MWIPGVYVGSFLILSCFSYFIRNYHAYQFLQLYLFLIYLKKLSGGAPKIQVVWTLLNLLKFGAWTLLNLLNNLYFCLLTCWVKHFFQVTKRLLFWRQVMWQNWNLPTSCTNLRARINAPCLLFPVCNYSSKMRLAAVFVRFVWPK